MKTIAALLILGTLLMGCGGSAPATQSSSPSAPAVKPDDSAAVEAIKKINEAQATFFKLNRRYAIEFQELIDANLLDKEPAATGYKFNLRPTPDASAYKMSAVPSESSARYFFTDQTGAIHAETGKEATAESAVL